MVADGIAAWTAFVIDKHQLVAASTTRHLNNLKYLLIDQIKVRTLYELRNKPTYRSKLLLGLDLTAVWTHPALQSLP
jgi:hypothetical protein